MARHVYTVSYAEYQLMLGAGEDLWYERWEAINWLGPDLVEIVTWNDWGESHYIGPLSDETDVLMDIGEAPYNYATGYPHDAFRVFL